MFRRLTDDGPEITLEVDGEPVGAREGETVAAALLAAGLVPFRLSAVGGEPRAPWCLIGNCFECLVEVDGVANRQACMVEARDGMRVRRALGRGGPGA